MTKKSLSDCSDLGKRLYERAVLDILSGANDLAYAHIISACIAPYLVCQRSVRLEITSKKLIIVHAPPLAGLFMQLAG